MLSLTNGMKFISRYFIESLEISATSLPIASRFLLDSARAHPSGYICVADARSAHVANLDPEFCRILNNSLLTVPDGKSLVLYGRFSGAKGVERTSGPDLFRRMCKETEGTELTHYFYGGKPEVLKLMKEKVQARYPGLKIVGAVSPPFAPVEELANDAFVEEINRLKPSFVWIGLGAPKQEFFMDLVSPRLPHSILVGVGLVFDYEAGTVKRAPVWMQKLGLEWAIRLAQQPYRIHRAIRRFSWMIPRLIAVYFKNRRLR